MEEDERAVKKHVPTLPQFQEQIDFYEGLHDKLKCIENNKTIQVSVAVKLNKWAFEKWGFDNIAAMVQSGWQAFQIQFAEQH